MRKLQTNSRPLTMVVLLMSLGGWACADTRTYTRDNVENWGLVAGQIARAERSCPLKAPAEIALLFEWSSQKHGTAHDREFERGFKEIDGYLAVAERASDVCSTLLEVIGPNGSAAQGLIVPKEKVAVDQAQNQRATAAEAESVAELEARPAGSAAAAESIPPGSEVAMVMGAIVCSLKMWQSMSSTSTSGEFPKSSDTDQCDELSITTGSIDTVKLTGVNRPIPWFSETNYLFEVWPKGSDRFVLQSEIDTGEDGAVAFVKTAKLNIKAKTSKERRSPFYGTHTAVFRTLNRSEPGMAWLPDDKVLVGCVPCYRDMTFIAVIKGEPHAMNGLTKSWSKVMTLKFPRAQTQEINPDNSNQILGDFSRLFAEAQTTPGCKMSRLRAGITQRLAHAVTTGECLAPAYMDQLSGRN